MGSKTHHQLQHVQYFVDEIHQHPFLDQLLLWPRFVESVKAEAVERVFHEHFHHRK